MPTSNAFYRDPATIAAQSLLRPRMPRGPTSPAPVPPPLLLPHLRPVVVPDPPMPASAVARYPDFQANAPGRHAASTGVFGGASHAAARPQVGPGRRLSAPNGHEEGQDSPSSVYEPGWSVLRDRLKRAVTSLEPVPPVFVGAIAHLAGKLAAGKPILESSPQSATGAAAQQALMRESLQIARRKGVDVNQVRREAANISHWEFLKRVKSGGIWDWKSREEFQNMDPNAAARFGNVMFGAEARAHGVSPLRVVMGAGTYQNLIQGYGGVPADALEGKWNFVKSLAATPLYLSSGPGSEARNRNAVRSMIDKGYTWGDRPEDSQKIMAGWDLK